MNIFGLGGSSTTTDRGTQLGSWGQLGNLGGYGTNQGEKNTNQAADFYSDILSGDPTKQAAAIAPEASVIEGQAEQQKKTQSEFGNRSGGTNATDQMIDTNAKSSVQNLINSLLPQAAAGLTQIGGEQLNLGESAESTLASDTESAREADTQQQNMLGGGIASLLKGGIGSVFEGLAGGGGAGDVLSSLAGFALA